MWSLPGMSSQELALDGHMTVSEAELWDLHEPLQPKLSGLVTCARRWGVSPASCLLKCIGPLSLAAGGPVKKAHFIGEIYPFG